MSRPLRFLANNTHLATRNPKFQTEIEPECDEDFFFWSSPEFRGKISNGNRIMKVNQTLQEHFASSKFA